MQGYYMLNQNKEQITLHIWTYYYFVMSKCMSFTLQFVVFSIMTLNITIVTSCDSLIVIPVPYFFHH